MAEKNFLDDLVESAKVNGFWYEEYRISIFTHIMSRYSTYVIRNYCITDVIMNGDKVMMKWSKRNFPLSDEEIMKQFGRDTTKE